MAPSQRPAPVQAILGEDTYLAEAALEQVLAAAVGPDRNESVRVIYGDEARWADVLAAARTGSLFASRRAVVVRRADMFAEDRGKKAEERGGHGVEERAGRGAQKGKQPEPEHPLVGYLDDPSPDVTLVLVAARPDRRRKPWARLPKDAIHDATPRRGRYLRSFVEEELRRRGLRFSRDALDQLIEEVGQDLRRLMGEVDKLEAWAAGRRDITGEDVASLLGRGLGQPLYLLSDAFAARDTPKTLELLERLLGDGEAGLRVLVTLHRSLRQVRGAVTLREAGVPKPQIGARLLPPNMQFKLDALMGASRRWSEGDLARAVEVLVRTDREIKQGANEAVALTAAVVAACGGAATSPRRGP
jgi:DNA polymerase-3 subunit delta